MTAFATEFDVCAAVIAAFGPESPHARDVREEVVVPRYRGALDLLFRGTTPTDVWFTAVECKLRLTAGLITQAKRWVGAANLTYVATPAPNFVGEAYFAKLETLRECGIGVLHVLEAGNIVVPCDIRGESVVPCRYYERRRDILERAWDAAPVKSNVPAGSAAGKRSTPARNRWSPATDLVNDNPGITAAEINAELVLQFKATAAAMRKAIDAGQWVGVRHEGHAITRFYPQG